MHDDFIGAGWAFPLRTNSRGGIALVRREQELEEAMRLILATYPGERPMRPEFGSRVRDWVFRGSDNGLDRSDSQDRGASTPSSGGSRAST